MSDRVRRVLTWDPYADPEGDAVEFRLTYEGFLFSSVDEKHAKYPGRTQHKHEIRQKLHPQLKRFWEIHPWLVHLGQHGWSGQPVRDPTDKHFEPTIHVAESAVEHMANTYVRARGFRFVPLVREELGLLCSVSILYLRPAPPGSIFARGDIDNRLKTLFDALKIPSDAEIPPVSPGPDENPMYVLLEDDSLITHAAVETDYLLKGIDETRPDHMDRDHARIVITVRLKPYMMTLGTGVGNMGFS